MIPIRITDAEPGPAPVTKLIIAACTAVFAVELSYGSQVDVLVWHWGIIPAREIAYWKHAPWMVWRWAPQLLTGMFLHGGWLHILGNMWFLWVFGPPLEQRMGSGAYAFLYLTGGLMASLTHIWMNPLQVTPMIGASGAIAAVLGAFLVLGPLRPVLTILLIIIFPLFLELPAFLVLAFWFFEQLLAGSISLSHQAGGAAGVAWWAHVGGFLAGALLVRILGASSWNHPEAEETLSKTEGEAWSALPAEHMRPTGFSQPRFWRPGPAPTSLEPPPGDGRVVILRDRWGRPVGRAVIPDHRPPQSRDRQA